MSIGPAIREAWESLVSNKMRSSLTILGIVIGVAAVIAMLAIGNGAQQAITGSISDIGSNLIFVFPYSISSSSTNSSPITMKDVKAISDPFQAPSVESVAPVVEGRMEATYSGNQTNTTVSGITPAYIDARNLTLSEGDPISETHILERASVALIGQETAKKLFDRTEGIVGTSIRIQSQPFRVIGVLTSKGMTAMGNQDDQILIPITTAQMRLFQYNRDSVSALYVKALDADRVQSASDEISQILRRSHRTPIGEDDFSVVTQMDFVATAQSITGILTVFLGGIAAISLLVGGIGIMNIMLVSVTERTREIGLRKALGARKRDILVQFLTESSLLSFFGGVLGIAFGWLIAFVVGQVAAASDTQLIPIVGLDAILLATLFSTAIGLFFGIYPANRAANLQPVEALRHE